MNKAELKTLKEIADKGLQGSYFGDHKQGVINQLKHKGLITLDNEVCNVTPLGTQISNSYAVDVANKNALTASKLSKK